MPRSRALFEFLKTLQLLSSADDATRNPTQQWADGPLERKEHPAVTGRSLDVLTIQFKANTKETVKTMYFKIKSKTRHGRTQIELGLPPKVFFTIVFLVVILTTGQDSLLPALFQNDDAILNFLHHLVKYP